MLKSSVRRTFFESKVEGSISFCIPNTDQLALAKSTVLCTMKLQICSYLLGAHVSPKLYLILRHSANRSTAFVRPKRSTRKLDSHFLPVCGMTKAPRVQATQTCQVLNLLIYSGHPGESSTLSFQFPALVSFLEYIGCCPDTFGTRVGNLNKSLPSTIPSHSKPTLYLRNPQWSIYSVQP